MTSMSATTAQACALYDQTGAHCWGDNWAGNTGDYNGSNDVICNYQNGAGGGGNINCQDRSAPHQVHTGGNYMAVVMGAANACGLDSSNDIHCWGAYAWNNVNQSYHQIWWGTRVPELMQLPGTAKIALDDLDSDGDGLNSPFDLWPEVAHPDGTKTLQTRVQRLLLDTMPRRGCRGTSSFARAEPSNLMVDSHLASIHPLATTFLMRVHTLRPYVPLDHTNPTLDPRTASSLTPVIWLRLLARPSNPHVQWADTPQRQGQPHA